MEKTMRRDHFMRVVPPLFGMILASSALAGGIYRDEGWWIVLASLPNPDLSIFQNAKIAKIRASAARCGFDPFNDFSNKFRGFAAGFDVVVLGAFESRTKAASALRDVRRCFPDAYLAFGKHLGE